MKRFGLILLAEEISKQPGIDSVVWLLVLTQMEVYNEKEQAEKIKIQTVQIENGVPRSGTEQNPVFKNLKGLKNGIKQVMTLGKDPTQRSFHLEKRN